MAASVAPDKRPGTALSEALTKANAEFSASLDSARLDFPERPTLKSDLGKLNLPTRPTPAPANVDLPELGIALNSKQHSFRDDGYVGSIESHSRELFQKEGYTSREARNLTKGLGSAEPQGRHMIIDDGKKETHVVFYRQSKDPDLNTFTKGHEQAHVLHAMGRIDLLEQALAAEGVVVDLSAFQNVSARQSSENEFIGDLGGLLALKRAGKDIASFAQRYNVAHRHERNAIDLFR